jgi:hypothetical protein
LFVCSIAPSGCTTSSSTSSSLSTPLSSQQRFSQNEALYRTFSFIHHPSSIIHHPSSIHPSIINLHRVTHSLTITQLFGVSAIITGAVAITGNSSSITGNSSIIPLTITHTVDPVTITHISTHTPIQDQLHVSFGVGEHCDSTSFMREFQMPMGECHVQDQRFTTIRARRVAGEGSIFKKKRCVLATFSDTGCAKDGAIIEELSIDDFFEEVYSPTCREVYTEHYRGVKVPAIAAKWACGHDIDPTWVDPGLSDFEAEETMISARSIDAEHDKDHVKVSPADNLNCNSAQHRDTDTKLQGHCHPFDKPFFSLRADIKRADKKSVIGGSEPCSVLVFSDKKCRRDGASIVDLNNTPSLGVCHNVTLHHGNNDAAIAGHSWKWVCGRQNIENCLKPVHHPKAHHSEAHNTVVGSTTKTVTATATTSLACSMTTEFAHYLDVLTSIITLKPVTHTSTSVFTKTKTQIRTKLITSVATDVSTVHHSVTKPYTTTYMVCDVNEGSQV